MEPAVRIVAESASETAIEAATRQAITIDRLVTILLINTPSSRGLRGRPQSGGQLACQLDVRRLEPLESSPGRATPLMVVIDSTPLDGVSTVRKAAAQRRPNLPEPPVIDGSVSAAGVAYPRMPSTSSSKKRSASVVRVAARLKPGVGPVRGREEDERGHAHVEVGAQLALLDALAEERADALLVAAALGEELLAALAFEVAPLADEHGRDVELLRRRRAGARAARAAASRSPAAARRSRRAPRGTRRRPSRATRRAGPPSTARARRASPSGRPSPPRDPPSTCRGSPARRRAGPPGASARFAGSARRVPYRSVG